MIKREGERRAVFCRNREEGENFSRPKRHFMRRGGAGGRLWFNGADKG